jgi:predicted ATPase
MAKYVITGGPGVGKTTICNLLAQRGYLIAPEQAREIIAEEQAKEQRNEHGILPWTNLYQFQRKVADRQVQLEQWLNDRPMFLDRGTIDGIAYCREGRIEVPSFLRDAARQQYTKIFLLDRLPGYSTDAQRVEGRDRAIALHREIAQAYRECGHEVIEVPVLRHEQRAQYIVERLR